ncbi:DNA alkylation repair protein [Granulicoccus sp. GXG6511]|uniref:DNA alkylation repair protein n=1 Tax=Granulicoccus sp. GXG6511 TaxID=3381351 RepID=UPI003D7EA724
MDTTAGAAPDAVVALVGTVRGGLAARADAVRAVGQQRYMKSVLPFHGVPVPEVRKLTREVLRAHGPLPDRATWERAVRTLWDEAGFREERYAALAVARHPRHRAFAEVPASLQLYRHLVLTGQWWDLCDETAHLVGVVLSARPAEIAPILRRWSRADDLWLRRVAILSQLDRKESTDAELLAYAIEGSIDDPDFFARKGIGWALRQHSKTDPAWVRRFVADHPELSRLSVREALRLLGR